MNDIFPKVGQDAVPHLTTDQMIEVDRAMIQDFGIELIQMMENAGRGLARLAMSRFLPQSATSKKVLVLAGRGGNGGGALVAARRLHHWGATVEVALTRPADSFDGIPKHQLAIVKKLNIPIHEQTLSFAVPHLIVDGMIGYSLKGAPREHTADLIQFVNAADTPVLSLDTPSGIDTTSGTVYDPAVAATATLTLALPKAGLLAVNTSPLVGELYLADISVPPTLYSSLGLTVSPQLFAASDIIRLT
ncbi:MAG: NAD(P)H-hydrate epimerase [Fuerstiella sp.]